MPDYLALKTEIARPAYAGMTDAAIVAALNAPVASTEDRAYADIADVFEAIVLAEYNALTAANRTLLDKILALPQVNMRGPNTRAWFAAIFAAGTQSRTNLLALQKSSATTSIAINVFGAPVQVNDLAVARAR